MRLKMVRRLVDVNIIYATQHAQLAKFRKKQEKNPTRKVNVSAQSIRTYIFIGLLYLFLFGILSSANAVSYTHLDVYKRQALKRFWWRATSTKSNW